VCLQTSNMTSCYKLQTQKHSRNWIIFQMQSPHDHVSYVMITDLIDWLVIYCSFYILHIFFGFRSGTGDGWEAGIWSGILEMREARTQK
jgi:hypothetical protein